MTNFGLNPLEMVPNVRETPLKQPFRKIMSSSTCVGICILLLSKRQAQSLIPTLCHAANPLKLVCVSGLLRLLGCL